MNRETKKIIGWILLITGLVIVGYISLTFFLSKILYILVSILLIVVGYELIRK